MKAFPLSIALGTAAVGLLFYGLSSRSEAAGPLARFPEVAPAAGFPVEVVLPDGSELAFEVPPRRVLPANAGAVDLLSLLVDPERVVAVPDQTDGFSRLEVDASGWGEVRRFDRYAGEVVLALEPDLVLTHSWQSPETSALLRGEGVPVIPLPIPETWDEVLDTLRLLARLLDAEERAAQVEGELDARVADLARRVPAGTPPRVLSYANFGAGGSTAGRTTTLDIVFGLAGLTNAATEAGIDGYAEIDHERLLTIDPDVIIVDAGEGERGSPPTARYLASQPELADLAALRADRVIVLPSHLFASVSTELVRAAEALQEALGWR